MPMKPILEIYVVWHPDDAADGRRAADCLTGHFQGPAYAGLAGGAVEVYSRSAGWLRSDGPPRPLPFMTGGLPGELRAAQLTAVVLVTGGGLARAFRRDDEWKAYVSEIAELCDNITDREGVGVDGVVMYRLPTGDDLGGRGLAKALDPAQALNGECVTSDMVLARDLSQAIWRDLQLAAPSIPEAGSAVPRLTVFVSHTKHGHEGVSRDDSIQERVRRRILRTRLDSFFDAQDIEPSKNFRSALLEHAGRCAMLMVRTDLYAGREWTQREVHTAKTEGAPIVALTAVTHADDRGCFLMDNVPMIPCPVAATSPATDDDNDPVNVAIDRALARLVDEALKRELWRVQTVYREDFDWLPAQAPEPATLAPFLRRHQEVKAADPHVWIMHPDPPLGPVEHDTVVELCQLAGFRQAIDVVTPRTFAARGGRHPRGELEVVPAQALRGVDVGISASQCADLARLGLSERHCEATVAAIARALCISGGRVVYGGSADGSYTKALMDELRQFARISSDEETEYLRLVLSASEHAHLSEQARSALQHEVARYGEVEFLDSPDEGDTVDVPAALTALRHTLTSMTDARVVIGGKLTGFQGRMPGPIEETVLSLQADQPVYAAGGFGGCGLIVARAFGADEESWRHLGLPAGDSDQYLDLVQRTLADHPRAEDGLTDEQRRKLAVTHRAGDVASLVAQGLSARPRRTAGARA